MCHRNQPLYVKYLPSVVKRFLFVINPKLTITWFFYCYIIKIHNQVVFYCNQQSMVFHFVVKLNPQSNGYSFWYKIETHNEMIFLFVMKLKPTINIFYFIMKLKPTINIFYFIMKLKPTIK